MRAAVLQRGLSQSGNDSDSDPFVVYAGLSEKQLRRAKRVMLRMETEKSLGEVLLELGDVTPAVPQLAVRQRRPSWPVFSMASVG